MSPANLMLVESGRERTLEQRSDDELMLLASGGHALAFGALVARHAARLRGYCQKLVGNAALAEELAQDTWLAVWNVRTRYVADGRFATFLYVAARNRCFNLTRDERKRAAQRTDSATLDAVANPSPDHLDALLAEEKRRRVDTALLRIPEKYRDVLVLRYTEGLEYADIARIVGRSEGGVRTRVHVGLQKLKHVLDKGAER